MDVIQMLILLFVIVMNVIGFAVMGIDKAKARKHKRRIPEKTIFVISILLGSIGTFAGMYAFRHKTRHMKFVIGIPLILVVQIVLGMILLNCI